MVNTRSSQNNVNQDNFVDAETSSSTPSFNNVQNNTIVKLPQFWSTCPHAWFIQVDLLFEIKNILNDDLKYKFVITSLTEDVILKILDIVQNPPQEDKYKILKNTLCERYSISDESRLEEIICNSPLGDKKPSELFREFTLLANTLPVTKELIFKLWKRKLPTHIQAHLTSSGIQSIEDKISLADKLHQNTNTQNISEIKSKEDGITNHFVQLTTAICESINALNVNIAQLNKSQPKFNNFTNTKQYSNNHGIHLNSNICWYHLKFGKNALKCNESCKYFKQYQNKSLN